MSEKTWGGEAFWGLGYEWDPDWVLTDRQRELRDLLIELCEKEMRANAKVSDDELKFPRRNLELLGEHGFLALTVPTEYGGLGEDHVAYAMTCETIARYGCASTAMCYVMHMGAVNAIMLRATDELIDRYIRPLNSGKIGTLSYSDPETGSHFWYPISSGAERSNGGYKVRKKASWTTSGGFADFYVVQTTSPDFTGYDDLSVFVIDGEHVKSQPSTWDALGLRGNQSGPIEVEDVEIPGDQIVGPEGDGAASNDESVDPWFLIGSSSVWNGLAMGAIDIGKRQTTRKRHVDVGPARRRLPDDPGLRRRGRDGHQRRAAVRVLGRAGDGQRHRPQHGQAPARRVRARELPALGVADQVRRRQEHRPRRRQDAARVRRHRLQARHGARALPARRQGRLGDGPDQRGPAPVRRQGGAARASTASTTGTRPTTAARSRTSSRSSTPTASASSPRSCWPRSRRPSSAARRRDGDETVLLAGGLLAPRSRARDLPRWRRAAPPRSSCAGDDRIRIIDRHGGQVADAVAAGSRRVGLTEDRARTRCAVRP